MALQIVTSQRRENGADRVKTRVRENLPLSAPVLVALGLTAVAVGLQRVSWQATPLLHNLMDTVAATTALFTGLVAFVRYYSRKSNLYLFVATGFVATALLDGYHVVVTSELITRDFLPSEISSLAPWSWNASRTFLAILMVLSWLTSSDFLKSGRPALLRERTVYAAVTALTLSAFAFFILIPLPGAYFGGILGRPQELVAALFFGIALLGFLRRGRWRSDPFEFWIVLSLVVGCVVQTIVMTRSFRLFDSMFNLAHVLKIASYSCVLAGLLINIRSLYRQSELSGRELTTIVESWPCGLLMLDRAGMVTLVNRNTEALFGYSRGELIGHSVEVLLAPHVRVPHESLIQSFFENPQPHALTTGSDLSGRRKDGSMFPLEVALTTVEMPEGRRALASIVDITDRRAIEKRIQQHSSELERSNSELDQFAYVASHDLKSPLRGIDHLVRFVIEDSSDQLSEDSIKDLQLIQNRIQRMEHLLNDLLQYSRVGRKESQPELLNLNKVLDDVIKILAVPPDFQIVVAENLPAVTGPRTCFELIFRNLIGNAIKHHDRPAGTIEINGTSTTDWLTIVVSDDGPGIPPQYHDRIFQMFQTLRPRDEVEGSGIGLSLVRKVLRSHGGDIDVDSHEGRGSMFRIRWPVSGS